MTVKIMVVDDDPEILKLTSTLIRPLGYEVLEVRDSSEAAQRIHRERFDGVILEAQMRGIAGLDLARRIRRSPSNHSIPIAMLIGGAAGNDAAKMRASFDAGVTFFLKKPLSAKKLRALLKTMHGSMLREKRRRVRLPMRTSVEWKVGRDHFRSTSLNISERGMLVGFKGDIAVGAEVNLHFVLPQVPGPLELRARVVRKEHPNLVALQFIEVGPQTHRALRDFIAGIVEG